LAAVYASNKSWLKCQAKVKERISVIGNWMWLWDGNHWTIIWD